MKKCDEGGCARDRPSMAPMNHNWHVTKQDAAKSDITNRITRKTWWDGGESCLEDEIGRMVGAVIGAHLFTHSG